VMIVPFSMMRSASAMLAASLIHGRLLTGRLRATIHGLLRQSEPSILPEPPAGRSGACASCPIWRWETGCFPRRDTSRSSLHWLRTHSAHHAKELARATDAASEGRVADLPCGPGCPPGRRGLNLNHPEQQQGHAQRRTWVVCASRYVLRVTPILTALATKCSRYAHGCATFWPAWPSVESATALLSA
jgi:hypothetical protein